MTYLHWLVSLHSWSLHVVLTYSHTGAVCRTRGQSIEHNRVRVSEIWWFLLWCSLFLNREVGMGGIIVAFLQDIESFLGAERLLGFLHRRVSDWVLSGNAAVSFKQSLSIHWRPHRRAALSSVAIPVWLVTSTSTSVELSTFGIDVLVGTLMNSLDVEVVKRLNSNRAVWTCLSATFLFLDFTATVVGVGRQVIHSQLTADTVLFFAFGLALAIV